MNRRDFLGLGLAAAITALVPGQILSAAEKPLPGFFTEFAPPSGEKKLSLYNAHTHENLDIVFWQDGEYIPEALSKINYLFRDRRSGKVKGIKTDLLDLLFSVQQKLECREPFHIISGYRSPGSNKLLRKRKKGVAKNSLHMYGKAVDIRLPGNSLKTVRKAAMSFRAGGVGYYPRSKFVHIDVGPVRYWWG
jgi:uncharacterized protein YcbK (DUF882 family)